MKYNSTIKLGLLLIAVILVITGCKKKNEDPAPTYTIGGTVSGLVSSGSVTLTNGVDEIVVESNGSFTFPTRVENGGSFNVTVKTNPTGQIASVENGRGTVTGANITNVTVTCTNIPIDTYLIGGTVSGLTGSLVLVNGSEEVTITKDGPYVFPTPLADGSEYDVKVKTESSGQQSTILNGAGTISGANVTNIDVSVKDLQPDTYLIGGTVTGLEGGPLVLVNGSEEIEITSDGPFVFPTAVADGESYKVTIKSEPDVGTCTIENGEGTVSGANVTNISITCTPKPSAPTYTIGGTVSGITGTIVIQNNNSEQLTISANGPFAFTIPLVDGSPYEITIVSQPDGEICSIKNNKGVINGANVSDIEVTCAAIPNTSDRYFVLDGEDPSIFYQFQNDLSLKALSTNGFGAYRNIVGLAYNAFSNKVYAYSSGSGKLLEVNPTTGVATELGNISININDLAFDKNAKKLYAIEANLGFLVELDTINAGITQVFLDDKLKSIKGLAYDPVDDMLYGTTTNQKLMKIDIGMQTVTEVGTTTSTYDGLAFDDDNEKLYGLTGTETSQLFEINKTSAAETDLGNVGIGNIKGLAFDDNINKIYGTVGDGNGKLFSIDQTKTTPTMSIGSTGIVITKGLGYSSADSKFYAIGTNDLMYTLNESTGVSTFMYQISAGIGNFGLTYDDESDQFFTVTGSQNLGIIKRTDGTGDVRTNTFTELIVDLAYDNTNNILYAASTNKIHIINTATGEISSSVDVQNLPASIAAINYDPEFNLIVAALVEPQPIVAIDPETGNSATITNTNRSILGIANK